MIDNCHIGISSHGDDEDDDGDEDIIGWKGGANNWTTWQKLC